MIWIPGGGINTGADADEDIDETDSKKADESSKHHQTMFDIQDYMADFDHDASVVYPMDDEYEPTSPADTPREELDDDGYGHLGEESPEGVLGELVPGIVGRVDNRVNRKNGILIEFCCSQDSALKRVCHHLNIAYLGVTKEELDIEDPQTFEQFLDWLQVEVQDGDGPVHLWASIPCTKWSPWQHMAVAKHGHEYQLQLEVDREKSRNMVLKFKESGEIVKMSRGGSVTFEWSKDSAGWKEPIVEQTMSLLGLKGVYVDGCAFGLEIGGKHPRRPWLIKSDHPKLLEELATRTCKHPNGYHDQLEGSLTTKSGFYNISMASCILACLFPGVMFDHVPAMPCTNFVQHPHRDKHLFDATPSVPTLGAIHKLLSRKEMMNDPIALQRVREEVQDFRRIGVWDDSTVMDRSDRQALAKRNGEDIHLAQLMAICSIKHWEIPSKRKHKARVVFRGDDVVDQYGGAARFGQMCSTPTNIQAVNIAIFYGMVFGHVIRVADATKAFLQALLLARIATYVELPPEMWLPEWGQKYKRPTVLLLRALYGHPQAGAYWDQHLRKTLIDGMHCVAVDGHPSVFFHETWKLLIVVYVDDILVAGPSSSQDEFWVELRKTIELDEVEELSQFLGRGHSITETQCVMDMRDYARESVALYLEIAGKDTVLRQVPTPFVSPGILTDEDYQSSGQIGQKASSILMKLLWLARLCRPDLSFPICLLAGQITTWSRNADKQLFRLVCYVNSTISSCLFMSIHDSPETCTLDLFCDADLGGCPHTAKSTSGMFLVIRGPKGTFVPLSWHARRQQHVARSTADAELNSMSEGMYEELLPTHQLLSRLFGDMTPKPHVREDNAAVVAAVTKGYSIKLRHLARTPKLSLAALHEACTTWATLVQTPTLDQLGDYFTKCLNPNKFDCTRLGLFPWDPAKAVPST